jgi:hypothetical protein
MGRPTMPSDKVRFASETRRKSGFHGLADQGHWRKANPNEINLRLARFNYCRHGRTEPFARFQNKSTDESVCYALMGLAIPADVIFGKCLDLPPRSRQSAIHES